MRPDGVSVEDARADVVRRLRARRSELLEAVFARVRDSAFAGAGEQDAEYLAGLRATVAAAVEYLLKELEQGDDRPGPIPVAVLEQARRAARVGVSLDTVLRRYVVGSALLGECIMEEIDRGDLPGAHSALRRALRVQASVLNRLLQAITVEYGAELERAERSPEQRRYERVRLLLDGTAPEGAELDYELGGWHLGLIASGAGAAETVRELAGSLDRRLLSVGHGRESIWAWFGGRGRFESEEVERILARARAGFGAGAGTRAGTVGGAGAGGGMGAAARAGTVGGAGAVAGTVGSAGAVAGTGGDAGAGLRAGGAGAMFAFGEPNEGLGGWRLTHRQAQSALQVALRRPQPAGVTRYADVALLAFALADEALAGSLIDIYLSPLDAQRGGGAVSRETLRAYLKAGRSTSSTAAALGVVRSTVENRLRMVEESLGRPLSACLTELEVALRLEELGGSTAPVAGRWPRNLPKG
jgi:hypothetical protein